MISLFYTFAVLMIVAYFMIMPKRRYRNPPSEGNDDDGGEPVDYDLPDLDLPPGISLPINDFEPDYNKKPTRVFIDVGGLLVYSKK